MKRAIFLLLVFSLFTLSVKASPFESERKALLNGFSDKSAITVWADSLVKYMPQSDLVSAGDSFLVNDLNALMRAKNSVPWANKIPVNIFYHYILPYRVSQEPLNNFRYLYSDTLLAVVKKSRNMYDAILNIDNWVTIHNVYKPTSPWDQSPIVTLKRGYGRCEEMATLLIMALRTVYIPARFVYTPWWPFTNSNHAWVEVYINGKWEYIGNLKNPANWVVAATKRTALVAGTVWGEVTKSDEPILNKRHMFTVFNSTSNYEEIKNLSVKVFDKKGIPVSGAKIYIYVYNYSAFRPIAYGKTDPSGSYRIETGKTDLLVTAALNGEFAWAHIGKENNEVKLQLSNGGIPDTSFWFYTIPPVKLKNRGKKYITPDTTFLARKVYMNKVNPIHENLEISFPEKDDSLFVDILKASCGNYKTILNFYNGLNTEEKKDLITVLKSIYTNKKDLVTIDSAEISSLLKWYVNNKKRISAYDDTIAFPYIISPRIYFESFGTYKDTLSFLFKKLSAGSMDSTVKRVINYVSTEIDTVPDTLKSSFGGLMNPLGTYTGKIGRPIEKEVLTVGILRSLLIPAKLNYMNNGIEYYNGKKWIDMTPKSKAGIVYSHVGIIFHNRYGKKSKFEYYYDFTINKIEKNRIVSLDIDTENRGDTVNCNLAPGNYFIISGWRNLYGTAFARIKNFKISSDTTIDINADIPINQAKTGNVIVRKFNPPNKIKMKDTEGKTINRKDLFKGENLILILDMHSESSISTVNKIKLHNWRGNVFVFTNGGEKEIASKLQNVGAKYRLFVTNKKTIKRLFHVRTYPSILLLKGGKTVLWIDGFNPDVINSLRSYR